MRSVVGSHRSGDFGFRGGANETPISPMLLSNRCGETASRQCLAGSFSGAEPSQKVTEGSIKVGLARMDIALDV